MTEYKNSVSGFKVVGSWNDVVTHGKLIGKQLNEVDKGEYKDEIQEFNFWRPKTQENIDEEISEKTAKSVSADVEKESTKQYEKAKTNALEGTSEINENITKAVQDFYNSIQHTINAVLIETKQAERKTEEYIYENIMTTISPYYFDNNLISANIQQNKEKKYTFEIDISDEEIKENISQKIDNYYK